MVRIDMTYHPHWIYFDDISGPGRERSLTQLGQATATTAFVETMSDMMRGGVTCGPFLWNSLKTLPQASEIITNGVEFRIKVPLPDGRDSTLVKHGVRIYSKTDARILCQLIMETVIGSSSIAIREPEAHELQLLWRHKGKTIKRPFYMIETLRTSLILDMDYDSGRHPHTGTAGRVTGHEAMVKYIDDYSAFRREIIEKYTPAASDSGMAPKIAPSENARNN